MILIDSYGWIEYFAEGPLADKYAKFVEGASKENTVTPTIVIYEVYGKIKGLRGEEKALKAYAQISRTRIIELTEPLSLEAADISLTLGLGMADSIIVATAKAYNAEIVTSDRHLKEIENVKFIGRGPQTFNQPPLNLLKARLKPRFESTPGAKLHKLPLNPWLRAHSTNISLLFWKR